MGCGAGYPKDGPCPFGFQGRVTRDTCGACKHFKPPAYILAWCQLYDRERVLCKLPKKACETCPEKLSRPPGRPRSEKVDWNDPRSVRQYMADYRERNRERIQERWAKWKETHPDYFKQYQQQLAAKEADEPGQGKV